MNRRIPFLLLCLTALCLPARAQDREALLKARIKHLEQRVSELEARLARLERLLGPEKASQPKSPTPAGEAQPQESPSAGSVRLRQVALARHGSTVTHLAWEPGGRHLVSGAYDDALRVWEGRNGRQVAVLPQRAWPRSVDWDPKGGRLVSGTSDHEFFLWELGRDKPLAERNFKGHADRYGIGALWFGPDSSGVVYVNDERLFGASGRSLKDARVGGVSQDGLRFPDDVGGVAWSPDRGRVAINLGKNLSVWDGQLRREQLQVDAGGDGVYRFAWGAKGKRLACASGKGRLLVWDVADRRLLRELQLNGVQGLAYSPDGAWLAVGSVNQVVLLDAESLAPTGAPFAYGDAVRALAWSPDGKVLAVGGKGGKIVILGVTK